jgi:ATP-binding cassette subfamily B protein
MPIRLYGTASADADKASLIDQLLTAAFSPRTRKLLSYYRPYRRLLAADVACAVAVSLTTLLIPLAASYITRHVLAGGAANMLDQIVAIGAGMLALVVVQTVSTIFVDFQGHLMGAKMEADMRRELFAHYQTLSFGFYDHQRTGQLMTRLTNDIYMLAEFFHHGPEDVAIAVVKFVGALIILFSINGPVTLVILLLLPPMALYAFYFNGRMVAALVRTKGYIGDINARAEDSLAGIRVVKSFANEAVENQRFGEENARFVASRREGYLSEAWFDAGVKAFTQLITITVIVAGAIAIANGGFAVGDLVTYLLCIAILVDPINRAVNFGRLYSEGITGFNRFMEMLEAEPEIADAPNAHALTDVRGHIVFDDVIFRYRDEGPAVLRHLSLDIAPGEFVALVGASGAGKTTLCALIPRFYEVGGGAVRIDGHDVRDVTLASLRHAIGVVQQDVYLFAGTVAENLRYGKPDADDAEIVEAAKSAHAHDFIMALPDGYDTDIGQRGVKLSGGQKQRLSIARVFLKNPPVLIFDEATSALDNESERAVRESLHRLAEGRTTLVIAHRLSTVRNAGRIVVLTDQGVAEQGTHADLIAAGGAYAGLYAMQASI